MGLDSLNEPWMPDLCQVLETRAKLRQRPAIKEENWMRRAGSCWVKGARYL